MVRKIHLKELYGFGDKANHGKFPAKKDYDEVIDEDCDVYLPDGSLAVVFRKGAIKSLASLTPDSDDYRYWKWASRSLLSDQRGSAAGKELRTNVEIRVTEGQKAFFSVATKKEITLEEALELTADDTPTVTTYFVGKAEADGLVDLNEVERWDAIVRKKATPPKQRKEATDKRNAAKLAWFECWLRTVWDKSEDKVAAAKAAKKRYVTGNPRGNKAYSAVFGTITRSGRTPFGRLTAPTLAKWEEFQEQKKVFNEVNELLKQHMPDRWELLNERFSQVADERYNLFGTVFTSFTINYNFQVARHVDGANSDKGMAVLSALDNGKFDGFEFVMHPLRLAFNMRHGDLFIGDNNEVEHSITEMRNASADAESITFVFYSKDAVLTLDPLECETCRREFMEFLAENHPELGTGEAKWNGSAPGMWGSQLWEDYKATRAAEGDFDYTKCSNTNIAGKPDEAELMVRQPHLAKS
jgi:hypothetical protein